MTTASYPAPTTETRRAPGPIDLMGELRRAIEDRDFEAASRCRRALVIMRPNWLILPLVTPPTSPTWGNGSGR